METDPCALKHVGSNCGSGGKLELLKQGAEGKIHVGHFLGRRCVVKERFQKKYRHPQLDDRLTKERIRAELRGIQRSRAIGIRTPAIYLVDSKRNAIVMEHIQNVDTVNQYIGMLFKTPDSTPKLEELASEMGTVIGKLHSADIIHGDLTTSNILVSNQGSSLSLCLIDFGLSHLDTSAEDKAVDLYVLERALTSTFSNIPWFFEHLLQKYRHYYSHTSNSQGGEEVYLKLEEVRLRGRKRTMVG